MIEQAKGKKDRYVALSPVLEDILISYYRNNVNLCVTGNLMETKKWIYQERAERLARLVDIAENRIKHFSK